MNSAHRRIALLTGASVPAIAAPPAPGWRGREIKGAWVDEAHLIERAGILEWADEQWPGLVTP